MIVMEMVDGQSLQQKIDATGALDVKSILRIGMQAAAGLSAPPASTFCTANRRVCAAAARIEKATQSSILPV